MSEKIELNENQRLAVEYPDGPLLVLAGPGTGKTGVIISRVAHLIEKREVEPSRILALTFSRRAADGMQKRLPESATNVEVRTFHSFALRLVRRHYIELGLKQPPEIQATAAQWATMQDLMAAENPAEWSLLPEAFGRPATVREVYDLMLRARENSCDPEKLRELGKEHKKPHLVRAGHVLEEYTRRLRDGSVVDYEQVVQQAISLLGDGREKLKDRYDHVLVDEFQDTNRSQLDLLKLLMPDEKPNIFCVGDDAQSIYGFRGARAENVRNFEEYFPGAKKVQLRINYRSAGPIVVLAGAALTVDEIARKRESQKLPGEKPGSVVRQVVGGDGDEGDWISSRILELRSLGVDFEDIAILRRSLLDSKPLVDALRSRGIPVDFSNTPARTGAARMRILLEAADTSETGAAEDLDPPPDEASRALVSPLCGMSKEGAHTLRTTASLTGESVFGMIRAEKFPVPISETDRAIAAATVAVVDEARKKTDFLKKLDHLWKNLPGTRTLFARHRDEPRAARALADAGSFLRAAVAYAGATKYPTVEKFIAAGTKLHDDSDTWAPVAPPAAGAVRLMTVHASKGLEFEAVFVSGLSEDRFPVTRRGQHFVDVGLLADGKPTPDTDLEIAHTREERRLFYVALTRAKTYLYLTGIAESSDDGAKASPFLTELEPLLAELESGSTKRRFWPSRDEAVEELRRIASDTNLPENERFAACRALSEMDERPDDENSPWWDYIRQTGGDGPPPDDGDLKERELVALLECPRRAFMRRLSNSVAASPTGTSVRGFSGKGTFGRVFLSGFEVFLTGEYDTLEEAVAGQVENGDFGGAAFHEHLMREVERVCPGCEEWAKEVRKDTVETGGEWTLNFGGRKVSGKHGPVLERDGERVHLKVTTGNGSYTQADVASDPALSLKTLGASASGSEMHFVRDIKVRTKRPKAWKLGDDKGWDDDFKKQVVGVLAALQEGEHPPEPKDTSMCENCEFRSVCPAYREVGAWA